MPCRLLAHNPSISSKRSSDSRFPPIHLGRPCWNESIQPRSSPVASYGELSQKPCACHTEGAKTCWHRPPATSAAWISSPLRTRTIGVKDLWPDPLPLDDRHCSLVSFQIHSYIGDTTVTYRYLHQPARAKGRHAAVGASRSDHTR